MKGLFKVFYLTLFVCSAGCNKMAFENPNQLSMASSSRYTNHINYAVPAASYMEAIRKCNGSTNFKFEYTSSLPSSTTQAVVANCATPYDTVVVKLPVTVNALFHQDFDIKVYAQGKVSAFMGVWSRPVKETNPWRPDDVLKPTVQIVEGPADPSADASYEFAIAASDTGGSLLKEYYCALDSNPFQPCLPGIDNTNVSNIRVNISFPIDQHQYTLSVYVVDGAGNQSSTATWQWYHDTSLPTCEITMSPLANLWTNGLNLYRNISVSCDKNPTTVICRVKDPASGSWTSYDCAAGSTASVSTRTGLGLQNNGQFDLEVLADNTKVATSTFKHDGTAPTATASGCPATRYSTQDGLALTIATEENLGGSGFLRLDCLDTFNGSTTTTASSSGICAWSGLDDGDHRFEAVAYDVAGNKSAPSNSCLLGIDNEGPHLPIILAYSNGQPLNPGSPTTSSTVTFTFTAEDQGPAGIKKFQCLFQQVSPPSSATVGEDCSSPLEYETPTEGENSIWVKAIDNADNPSEWASFSWTLGQEEITVPLRDLALGSTHACSVFDFESSVDGPVNCWGNNSDYLFRRDDGINLPKTKVGYFKLTNGDGTPASDDYIPLRMSIGKTFNCVLLKSGKVRCWGKNEWGQLGGIGPCQAKKTPTPYSINTWLYRDGQTTNCDGVTSQHTVFADESLVSPAYDSTAYTVNGTVNYSSSTNVMTMSSLSDISSRGDLNNFSASGLRFTKIVTGDEFVCGLDSRPLNTNANAATDTTNNRSVWCWGRNDKGQLGMGVGAGNYKKVPWPQRVVTGDRTESNIVPLGNVKDVAAGGNFACAVSVGNTPAVYCWGDNTNYALGLASPATRSYAVQIGTTLGNRITHIGITAGSQHVCTSVHEADSASERDSIYCWGSNNNGQQGNGDTYSKDHAAKEVDFTDVSFCAADKRLIWQNGPSGFRCKVTQLVASGLNTCAIISKVYNSGTQPSVNQVFCWGDNKRSVAGFKNYSGDDDIVKAPKGSHLNSNGLMVNNLQYPTRLANDVSSPHEVSGGINIRLGHEYGCMALNYTDSEKGGIYCWGNNNNQLGSSLLALGAANITQETAKCSAIGNTTDSTKPGCSTSKPVLAMAINSPQNFIMNLFSPFLEILQ